MASSRTVRDAVIDQLIAECGSFDGFYQPQLADKNTPAPFGVVLVGPEYPEGHGLRKHTQVAVHSRNRDDLNELDSLCYEVIDALNKVRVDCGESKYIIPEHIGTMTEYFDDDRQTVMKIVEFEIVIAR